MKLYYDFSKEELVELRERAKMLADRDRLHYNWKKAYENLAEAADILHAYLVRLELEQLTKDKVV